MDKGSQFPEQLELSYEAYRGVPRSKVNMSNLGSHWSTDQSVASYFAGSSESLHPRAIVKAQIPISSVETDPAVKKAKGVGDTQDFEGGPLNEKEITVKEGAPVRVQSMWKNVPIKRSKKYKEAKENYNPYRSVDYMDDDEIREQGNYLETLSRTQRTRSFNPPRPGRA